jgi:hypothetical protein
VLTLWAAVVAQRLGFTWPEAVSLGKALAGLNAQSKGRRLGLFKPHEEKPGTAREKPSAEEFFIELCGRPVPAKNTPAGIRAVKGAQVVTAESAEAYLESKFGAALEPARLAFQTLARAYRPAELAHEAFTLYEKFRPEVPEGVQGWGAKGVLNLGRVRKMATRR